MRSREGRTEFKLRRDMILEDSFTMVMRFTGEGDFRIDITSYGHHLKDQIELKRRLMIHFEHEDGLDYGGISRCAFI